MFIYKLTVGTYYTYPRGDNIDETLCVIIIRITRV